MSYESLPPQDEITEMDGWNIDNKQAANAGDIEKQSADGNISFSIKVTAFSTYNIRAKSQKVVSSDYDFNCVVDLSDNAKITTEMTVMQNLSVKSSIEIHE